MPKIMVDYYILKFMKEDGNNKKSCKVLVFCLINFQSCASHIFPKITKSQITRKSKTAQYTNQIILTMQPLGLDIGIGNSFRQVIHTFGYGFNLTPCILIHGVKLSSSIYQSIEASVVSVNPIQHYLLTDN